MSKRRKKKGKREEKKNLQISADVTKEDRRGGRPEARHSEEEKRQESHTHVHQRKTSATIHSRETNDST